MQLSIIIVNWNSANYLRGCLDSIGRETKGLDYEIVVIDAGSFDGCDRLLREHYPQVRYIQSQQNLGFAKANNLAFQVAKGESVLFLNPDTELLGPAINVLYNWLWLLPDAGAIGCKLLNSDGTLQTSCVQSTPTILNQFLDSQYLRAKWPRSPLWGTAPLYETGCQPKMVEAVSGACILAKRSAFDAVGRFSEDYFMYAEDIDLCDKMRQAGYKNYFVPDANIIHHGGGSSQKASNSFSNVMLRESNWRFLRKTRGSVYGTSYRISVLFSALIRLVFLVVLMPVEQARRRRDNREACVGKWQAVLRWSLRGEKALRKLL